MSELIQQVDAPIKNVNIEEEMKTSYLDYAMSVIVGRALPDIRDGLKPVHRRTLFAMHELGNNYNKSYKKSARIVGDVIGKFHPHGDTAVYDTIVRMAQVFSLRYPMVDGQGNFGSIDGDAAAAMRYTEVRMTRLAGELIADIDKDTVDFGPNYDETLAEPLVFPARFPGLLVNGSSGIAVGMATNIPPHNLAEVTTACIHLIKNPDAPVEELMEILPGPDFPTAGFIYGTSGIRNTYTTGRGHIQMRARSLVEYREKGKTRIVITELPYQVNKARLVEKIAELVKDRKIEGISDLRDESDREGMRIVLELKRDEIAEVILNQLYSMTQMKTTFAVQMLAIHRNRPVLCSLPQMLGYFIDFRVEVVTRRTQFLLTRAEERAHILEGLKIALDNIDEVVDLIKKSADVPAARTGLITRFGLSERQSNAILEMRLSRLTGLEREKIDHELRDINVEIARLRGILADESILLAVIIEELEEIRDRFGDERRTEIVADTEDLSLEDLILDEEMLVTVSHAGYIKRSSIGLYRSQHRGGKGLTGLSMRDQDFAENIFVASTHSYILFFTDRGRLHWRKVHQVPQLGRAARGKAMVNLLNLEKGEVVTAYLSVREFSEDHYVLMVTEKGVVKKTALSAFSNPRAPGIIALALDQGDRLISTVITDGVRHILMATRKGRGIRFHENDVRAMGRTARGMRGINLEPGDRVVGMELVNDAAFLLTVTETGYGKRTPMKDFNAIHRGGKGVRAVKVTEKGGGLVGILQVGSEEEIMAITDAGRLIRIPVKGISIYGRNSQGVKLMDMSDTGEKVVSIALVQEGEE
ncbi:MAG: DNA gyrase subunit A [Deltaproteobacteria bacterium]|nr:DNA gyrase subunit A [Deltaproteobacteria bacterium]